MIPSIGALRMQNGAALIVMLVIMILGAAAFLLASLNSSALQNSRDRITTDALAQAKEALIGYAAKVQISASSASNQPRPGDLPCPDTNNDGLQESSCGNAAGSTGQAARLGRLPWKTLGLPDLRDASGERLWYAVSNNFKYNTRNTTLLNSDTPGTITVRDSAGNIIHNGCAAFGLPACPTPAAADAAFGTGAVAVIIAPGGALTRQGSGSSQDRSSGINIASNYLDIATLGGIAHDNQNFADASSLDGFIQGDIKIYDAASNSYSLILNDRLLVITQNILIPLLQKRVAAEVKLCLTEYANNNHGRYPWAVPLTDLTYQDTSNQLFGRIPDNLNKSYSDSGNIMNFQWEPNCNTHNNITPSTWWKNWREMVFYGLADAYKPMPGAPAPATDACATSGACLSVAPPSASTDKQFVVIIAGKMLVTQSNRPTNKNTLSNYLEAPNSNAASPFAQSEVSATFNDTVIFQ